MNFKLTLKIMYKSTREQTSSVLCSQLFLHTFGVFLHYLSHTASHSTDDEFSGLNRDTHNKQPCMNALRPKGNFFERPIFK